MASRGQAASAAPKTPELIVVVDTTPPKVRLGARRGPTGETIVHWQIEELHPKPGSLSIQYRGAATMPWRTIKFEHPQPGATGPVASGEVALYPPADVAQLELRAEVFDLAGNAGVSQTRINLRDLGPAALTPASPSSPLSPLSPSSPTAATSTTTPPPAAVTPIADNTQRPPTGQQDGDAWRASPDPPPTTWPAARASSPNQVANDRGPAGGDLSAGPLRSASGQTRVDISDQGKVQTQDGSVAVQFNQPGRDQLVGFDGQNRSRPKTAGGGSTGPATGSIAGAAPSSAATGLPPTAKLNMINSRIFELDYDLESVGPSGVKQIELWGTRDGGRTWKRFAVDESKRSPLVVTVPEAGIYGFRLVVESGAGRSDSPPQSGDPPKIWIGVDLTKPTVRITSAAQGSDADSNNLNISWQASDNMMLAARPISLSFSQTPGGPWIPMASGLANTGHYSWPIDNQTPSRIYLRIEARDEAGNIGVYETTQPVAVDQMVPKARIRDVHPVGQSGLRLAAPSDLR